MNCDQARDLVAAYADGELAMPHAGELEQHIEACAVCRGELAETTELRASVRSMATYHAAPAGLAAQVHGVLPPLPAADGGGGPAAALSATSAAPRKTTRFAAAAIACVLALVAGLYIARPFPGAALEDELVASHARALLTGHAIDVASSDRHAVKPWFNGRLDFSPAVYDLAAQGFALAGARIDYVNRRPVAALVYRRHLHPVDLFVWPAGPGAEPPSKSTRQGYNLLHWRRGGLNYWAVSDLNAAELAEFRDMLLQAVD